MQPAMPQIGRTVAVSRCFAKRSWERQAGPQQCVKSSRPWQGSPALLEEGHAWSNRRVVAIAFRTRLGGIKPPPMLESSRCPELRWGSSRVALTRLVQRWLSVRAFVKSLHVGRGDGKVSCWAHRAGHAARPARLQTSSPWKLQGKTSCSGMVLIIRQAVDPAGPTVLSMTAMWTSLRPRIASHRLGPPKLWMPQRISCKETLHSTASNTLS